MEREPPAHVTGHAEPGPPAGDLRPADLERADLERAGLERADLELPTAADTDHREHDEHDEHDAAAAARGWQPDPESRPPDASIEPRYARLGVEGLARLRARYAEVMARITERPLEEAVREELRTKAERLNPDGWVTEDEVAAALEQYEVVFEELRAVVGRHPRHRRRRV